MMRRDGERLYIRVLGVEDAEALTEMTVRNMDFWQWVTPQRDEEYYKLENQRQSLEKAFAAAEQGTYFLFGIFLKETDELIGDISIMDIRRHPNESCYVGYALDQAHVGKGYASEAVEMAVEFAFADLKLHRVQAGVQPINPGSMRVLEKLGFRSEGLARENVKIAGKWTDHMIYAILEKDWEERKGMKE